MTNLRSFTGKLDGLKKLEKGDGFNAVENVNGVVDWTGGVVGCASGVAGSANVDVETHPRR